ncbi:myristylated tegument protein [Vespertilionid gammaherpesvirus 1]|uniref:Cytoplasmic envelopment protein 3 n=1 Tax=Vespertilionid gammaherpesvirus 1 TaxID=2560830 RepID=A0A0X9WR23_9GAMA|nr:myristylated tegument protein [Myotis gammaherpesvirus 8]AMA67394.1 myristylated tegument protein [Vespertilionid gammaherpesvirus 1]
MGIILSICRRGSNTIRTTDGDVINVTEEFEEFEENDDFSAENVILDVKRNPKSPARYKRKSYK